MRLLLVSNQLLSNEGTLTAPNGWALKWSNIKQPWLIPWICPTVTVEIVSFLFLWHLWNLFARYFVSILSITFSRLNNVPTSFDDDISLWLMCDKGGDSNGPDRNFIRRNLSSQIWGLGWFIAPQKLGGLYLSGRLAAEFPWTRA